MIDIHVVLDRPPFTGCRPKGEWQMKKMPKPIRQLAITLTDPSRHFIVLSAVPDIIESIREFPGTVECEEMVMGAFHVFIDPRYDFAEVVKWIESMAQEADR